MSGSAAALFPWGNNTEFKHDLLTGKSQQPAPATFFVIWKPSHNVKSENRRENVKKNNAQ